MGSLSAEVFGDDRGRADGFFDGGEEFVAGDGEPFSLDAIFGAGGDGPEVVEAEEVIDARGVELGEEAFEASDPPGEVFGDVGGPAVMRVAPELAEFCERVGGIAADDFGFAAIVQEEKMSAGPDGYGIVGDEDGDVADESDAEVVAIIFERGPLAIEEPLDEFLELDLVAEIFFGGGDGIWLAEGEAFGPALPGDAALVFADGEKEGVVV